MDFRIANLYKQDGLNSKLRMSAARNFSREITNFHFL